MKRSSLWGVRGAGIVLGAVIAACMTQPTAERPLSRRIDKMNELTALWVQVRDWRREAGMELDPSNALEAQFRGRSVKEARRVCPDNHVVPKTRLCNDTCSLSDAICENAEAICNIADELGKDDPAQEKCTSAKASCREAKQRCCNCVPPEPVTEEAAP
jgi:hypothetical protein